MFCVLIATASCIGKCGRKSRTKLENLYVTLVNRSSKDLTGHYDGREHTIKANSRTSQPAHLAMKFKEQNPVMGSENFYSGDKQYLLGIEEYNDPVDPIEQTSKDSLIDYQTILVPPGVKLEVLQGRTSNPRVDFNRPMSAQVLGFEPNNDIPGSSKPEVVHLDGEATFDKP
jgi:hypothetical protein